MTKNKIKSPPHKAYTFLINEDFIIEDDVIVPDIKPDIINAVSTSGTVCIYKKEISNGKVKIEGKIDTYIMYLADTEDGYIRSLNTSLEFSQSFNINFLIINLAVF